MVDKDKRQTEACETVHRMLQSIAIQAVEAQDCIGSDRCSDLLADIQHDVERAIKAQRVTQDW